MDGNHLVWDELLMGGDTKLGVGEEVPRSHGDQSKGGVGEKLSSCSMYDGETRVGMVDEIPRSQGDKRPVRSGDERPRHHSRWEILGDQPKEGGEGGKDEYDMKRGNHDRPHCHDSMDGNHLVWDELLLAEVGDQPKGQVGGRNEDDIKEMEDDFLSGSEEEFMKGLNDDLLSGNDQSSKYMDDPDTNLSGRQGGSPSKEIPMSGMNPVRNPVTTKCGDDLVNQSGSPTTIQVGQRGCYVLRRGKQFVDTPGVDKEVVISVPDTSSDEDDKITAAKSPQNAMGDDEDLVIPSTPEPSRGIPRNYSNRMTSQKISGKNLENLFIDNHDIERSGDSWNSDGDMFDAIPPSPRLMT